MLSLKAMLIQRLVLENQVFMTALHGHFSLPLLPRQAKHLVKQAKQLVRESVRLKSWPETNALLPTLFRHWLRSDS